MRRILIVLGVIISALVLVIVSFNAFHRSTWGAIYIAGDSSNVFGLASNAASGAEADTIAKQECQKQGTGTPCIKIGVYSDRCAAVTYSDSHYYDTQDAANLDDAKGRALVMCTKDHPDGSCKILVAACSSQASGSTQ